MDTLFNILCQGTEDILRYKSGIADWEEDLQHLNNQMTREQRGCCDSIDQRQKKRDMRKLMEKNRLEEQKNTKTVYDQDDTVEDVDED